MQTALARGSLLFLLKSVTRSSITHLVYILFPPVPCDSLAKLHGRSWLQTGSRLYTGRREALFEFKWKQFKKIIYTHVRMCDVHKTERAVPGPFSARFWSVQYPFESRLTYVLLKRSGVKQTVHGRFFLPHTLYIYTCDPFVCTWSNLAS